MMYPKDYYREHKSRKIVTRMDPDCAICRAPASLACDCEVQGLEIAITQAETQMMQSVYDEIKTWVREHARDFILEYFAMLKERRIKAHDQAIERLKQQAYYYRTQPHPSDIATAQAAFKRGIDEDWQSSVQRYPEVLEYYYGLVELNLPADDDPKVRDPPLSALSGSRKARRPPPPATITNGPESMAAQAPPLPPLQQQQQQQQPPPLPSNRISYPVSHQHQREVRGRTPPPPLTPMTDRMGPISDRDRDRERERDRDRDRDRMVPMSDRDRMGGPMSDRDRMVPMTDRMMPIAMDRRTPVSQGRRASFRNGPPTAPPSGYYPPPY